MPKQWVMLADKFNLTEEQLCKTYLPPLHVAPSLMYFPSQYKGVKSHFFDVISNILSKLCSCRYLLLSDVITRFLIEEMDLVNYVLF